MRPLTGAVVQLALVPTPGTIDTVRSVVTDSLGRYDFAGDPARHVPARLPARGGGFVRPARAAPARRRPDGVDRARADGGALDAGDHQDRLRSRRREGLAGGAAGQRAPCQDGRRAARRVRVRSAGARSSSGRSAAMQRTTPIVDTFANDEGWFTACVPGGVQMTVRATHDTDLSGNVELGVPAHAVLRRDIYVGPSQAEVRGPDSARRPVARARSASSNAAWANCAESCARSTGNRSKARALPC